MKNRFPGNTFFQTVSIHRIRIKPGNYPFYKELYRRPQRRPHCHFIHAEFALDSHHFNCFTDCNSGWIWSLFIITSQSRQSNNRFKSLSTSKSKAHYSRPSTTSLSPTFTFSKQFSCYDSAAGSLVYSQPMSTVDPRAVTTSGSSTVDVIIIILLVC